MKVCMDYAGYGFAGQTQLEGKDRNDIMKKAHDLEEAGYQLTNFEIEEDNKNDDQARHRRSRR